jgi:hypothetical protein
MELTLYLVDQDPLTKVIGEFNIAHEAYNAYARMVAAAELLSWHERKGQTVGMRLEERKERAKDN